MKRCVAFLLCLWLLTGVAFASPMTMMGLELDSNGRSWETSLFFQRMETLTGAAFTFQQYADRPTYKKALSDAFANNALPDVLFKADLSPAQEIDWLASGQLVDLAPYLPEYAPNLWTILTARPDWLRIIAQPNGAIASLPVLAGAERQGAIWVNQSWLTAVGLDAPKDMAAYTDMLRAFRNLDPNGNGKPDEIPLTLVGPWEAKFFLHAFGIVADDYNLFVDEAGTVHFAPFESSYRAFVEWLLTCSKEQLIDKNAFKQTQSMRSALLTNTEQGQPITLGGMVSFAPYSLVDMDKTAQFVALSPLQYEGKQVFRQLLTGVGRGAFAITSACDDIPAALAFADYLYTEAGGRLAFAGLLGEDYTFNADGTWQWSSNGDYLLLTDLIKDRVMAGDAHTPGLEPAAFLRNTEIVADNYTRRQVDTLKNYLVEPFPVTWPTDAAREERIAALQTVLGSAVDNGIANFALGITELTDANWGLFLSSLQDLGVDEFLSLWQAKYDETL